MSGTDELIRHALNTGAKYHPATQADWAEFDRRLHQGPRRRDVTGRRRWLLPAVAAATATGLIIAGVLVGAQVGAPTTATSPASQLTVISAPAANFSCSGSGGPEMTSIAARLPDAVELGKPIDVGIRGSTFCAAFAEGYGNTSLAESGPLRAFIATGGVGNITIGVVDSTVTAITFTPNDPALAPTSVTTVVDLGGGLRGFYVPYHADGTVTVTVDNAAVATTSVPVIHGDPSGYPTGTGDSQPAVMSAAQQPKTITCQSNVELDHTVTISAITPTDEPAPGTAVLGYESLNQSAGDLPAQCLLVTEDGRTLTGQTALDTRGVLQYAGRVDGAHGTYQFVSAVGITASIRLTRADGTNTTLTANQLTPTPAGFVAALIYTPDHDPLITQATAINANGRDLNTLHLP